MFTIMWQYYRPVIKNKDAFLNPLDLSQWSKLMEHAYVNNELVEKVINFAFEWETTASIEWAWDYGDSEPCYTNEEDEECNLYEYADLSYDNVLNKTISDKHEYNIFYCIANHQYCIVPAMDKLTIHPLPLLCTNDNGRWGWDYKGTNEDQCGIWVDKSIAAFKTVEEFIAYLKANEWNLPGISTQPLVKVWTFSDYSYCETWDANLLKDIKDQLPF